MIKAVIFDMDGLLIDSEPLWKEGEVAIFNSVGVPLTYEMTDQTMGLRTEDVVEHWHKRYPWQKPSKKEVAKLVDQKVSELISQKAVPKVGVIETVAACKSLGIPMAIASSSSIELIKGVIYLTNPA